MINEKLKNGYCWIKNPPAQRLTHVYFRREFSLDALVLRAEIHLYAHNLYQLFVNGKMIGTGPARSYPEFPEYDTYQIAEYLQEGDNVIAVNVAHHGMATFHHLFALGGFTAAGSIETANNAIITLGSPGEWLCRKSKGYKSDAQRFSFAVGSVQTFDARIENDDWKFPGTPSGEWDIPALMETSEPIDFHSRSIPNLTNESIAPAELLSANNHTDDEQYYTLSFLREIDPEKSHPESGRGFVYSYIYSLKKQLVNFGGWWGEYFINGRKVNMFAETGINMRQQGIMDLEAGWNFFIFSVASIKDICEMHIAVPASAELRFSAYCDMDISREEGAETLAVEGAVPASTWRVTKAFDKNFADRVLDTLDGKELSDITELQNKWKDYIPPEIPDTNTKHLSWIQFGENSGFAPGQLENIKIDAEKDYTLIFDMGNIFLGRIFVEYNAPENTIIDIGYAEELLDGRINYEKNFLVNSTERQICANGDGRMETFAPRGLRYLQISITQALSGVGAETLDKEREGCPVLTPLSIVTIKKVGMMSQIYPYIRKGEFECSDPDFNKLYEWGWRTLQLCSEDVITDCPWRERSLYGGDLLPEAATAMVMTGDLRLVKRSIEIFLQSQDGKTGWLQSMAPMKRDRESLFDYPPLVLVNTEWYCRLAGDADFAEHAYPVFKKMLDHALEIRYESGLFPATYKLFIEHDYAVTEGVVCAFNALMASTFSAWASLLTMLNRSAEAEEALAISKDISLRISQKLWDEKSGAFLDAVGDNGLCSTHGIAANSWPKLFADVDDSKWAGSLFHMRKMMDHYSPYKEAETVSTYGAFYYLGALYKAGEAEFAEESIRKIYNEHLLHPTGTIWEHAHPKKSLVHAWSTAPNFYFATCVLGVQLGFPEETDLTKITIAPQSETLTWAKGTVPHPLGNVSVDWKIEGNKLLLNYQTPEGVEVIVTPKGHLAELK